jgi:hypothetical protein
VGQNRYRRSFDEIGADLSVLITWMIVSFNFFKANQKAKSLPILKIFLGAIAVDSTLLYKSEAEKQQHLSVVSMLAHELGFAEASVRQIYEDELQALQKHARVRTFLSVFVSRNVKKKIAEHGVSPG